MFLSFQLNLLFFLLQYLILYLYLFDTVLKELYAKYFIETAEITEVKLEREQVKDQLMIGIVNLDDITIMRNLTPRDINKLICFRGLVVRNSEVQPEMKGALFRCINCKLEK